MSCPPLEGVFYIFIDVGTLEGANMEIATTLLYEYRMVTAPGGGFFKWTNDYFQITYAIDTDRLAGGSTGSRRKTSTAGHRKMTGRLDGRRTAVFGASRGIGRAVAVAFADEGADVAVLARTVSDLETVADMIDGRAIPVECDVTDETAVRCAVETVVASFGGLDAVVYSVGFLVRELLVDLPPEDVEKTLDVNLRGAVRVARKTLPFLETSGGSLTFVSSVASKRGGTEGLGTYGIAKGGIDSLTRHLACEHASEGVTVNAILPGTIRTPINKVAREDNPEWERRRRAGIPLGRIGEPTDVAGPTVFLASDEARYITGHLLFVDGGMHIA